MITYFKFSGAMFCQKDSTPVMIFQIVIVLQKHIDKNSTNKMSFYHFY